MSEAEQDVTVILQAVSEGEDGASERLFERVYSELRAIAGRYMAQERADHTLQPTAVVNEAYLRLCGGPAQRWETRAHFFAAAAEAMRRILIDHARRKRSLKRGGDQTRIVLADVAGQSVGDVEELLAMDAALQSLELNDPQMAQVVKLRFFAGLSVNETAQALDTSPRSVNRAWTGARAWLRREMTRRADPGG
jgi:RNA polymerase sigma factor (TIGR02999 family)